MLVLFFNTCVDNFILISYASINTDLPICKSGQRRLQVVDEALAECEVEAQPTNVTFFWRYNHQPLNATTTVFINSSGSRARSRIHFHPTESGELSCWAQNEAGIQIVPCRFMVAVTPKPIQPTQCNVNATHSTIFLTCLPHDHHRTYLVQVFNSNGASVANVSSNESFFAIKKVEAATNYHIIVSVNDGHQQRNLTTTVRTEDNKPLKSEPLQEPSQNISTWAIVAGLVLSVIICVTVRWCRKRRQSQESNSSAAASATVFIAYQVK